MAHEIPDRQRRFAAMSLAIDAIVNPGAIALAATREHVGIETANAVAIAITNVKITCILMPGNDAVVSFERNAVEFAGKIEQSVDHLVDGKILAQFLVGKRVFFLL